MTDDEETNFPTLRVRTFISDDMVRRRHGCCTFSSPSSCSAGRARSLWRSSAATTTTIIATTAAEADGAAVRTRDAAPTLIESELRPMATELIDDENPAADIDLEGLRQSASEIVSKADSLLNDIGDIRHRLPDDVVEVVERLASVAAEADIAITLLDDYDIAFPDEPQR
jgi:hypothetical protein